MTKGTGWSLRVASGTPSLVAPGLPASAPPTSEPVATPRLPQQPGLDGVRGAAVAAVLLYHGAAINGVGWLEPVTRGGYLGVSAFFTLSGFLITSLLLEERRVTGTVSAARFWERRARRLLPASLLLLAAVVVLTPLVGSASQLRDLKGDVWASLAYVVNWRFVAQGSDYAQMFAGEPSPLKHLWSLSVEEQWYLLVPLAALVALRWQRRRARPDARRRLALALCAAVGLATVWTVVVAGGAYSNRTYMGTDTRFAEMAVGAAAAALLARGFVLPPRWRRAVQRLAPATIVVVLVLWALTPLRASWLYRGGLTLHAVAVAVVLVAVVQPGGPSRRLLSTAGLVALGRISYGVYLFHWPIMWWLTPERLGGIDPTAALVVQVACCIALAALSFRLLEVPVRHGGALRGRRGLAAALAAVVVVAVAAAFLPAPRDAEILAIGRTPDLVVPTTTAPTTAAPTTAAPAPTDTPEGAAPAPTTTAPPPPPEPLRVMVVGDSFAESIVVGLQRWGLTTGSMAVMNQTIPACPFGRGGRTRGINITRRLEPQCVARDERLLGALAEFRPEVVVVAGSLWDVTDRQPPGFRRWTRPGDQRYDEWLWGELGHLADMLAAGGARVLWADSPDWDPVPGSVIYMGQPPYSEADPARVARFNSLLADFVAARPDVESLALRAWMESHPGGQLDRGLRPDGVHFSEQSTDAVAAWLGPVLLELRDDVRSS